MSSVGAVARRFGGIIVGVILLLAGLWVGSAYGAPATPEKVGAWSIKGGLKGFTFGFAVSDDEVTDCLDASSGGRLSVLCTWPVLLDGQTFRGGVVLIGGRYRGEVDPVLTNLVFIDTGAARCARLRSVALAWRSLHRAQANGQDNTSDTAHELSWRTGTTGFTFESAVVGADSVGMYRIFQPEALPTDIGCKLTVLDLPSFRMTEHNP